MANGLKTKTFDDFLPLRPPVQFLVSALIIRPERKKRGTELPCPQPAGAAIILRYAVSASVEPEV